MSDPRSPLQHAWHFALLILGITIALTLAVWLLSRIYVAIVIVLSVMALGYGAYLWLQHRRGRW